MTLIDSKVCTTIAPNARLGEPVRLISASRHQLNVIGTCSVTVELPGFPLCVWDCCVVENLAHDFLIGFDFLQANNAVIDFSLQPHSAKIKIRIFKPVSVPAYTAMCVNVRIDQDLSPEHDYLLVGQYSDHVEIQDAVIRPLSKREIPIYIRNRTDQLITFHRRSVIGFVERFEGDADCFPVPTPGSDRSSPDAPTVNAVSSDVGVTETVAGVGMCCEHAVSADDSRFLGASTDDVLDHFCIGDQITGQHCDKLATLLKSQSEVFSRGYADIGSYKGEEVDLELEPGTRPQFSKPYPIPWARESQLKTHLDELHGCGIVEQGPPSEWNSPILLIAKPTRDGTEPREYRIVQDLRNVNKCLLGKKFVFPSIDDFLFSLHGWQVASSLDVKHAFWNLHLTQRSSEICAFHALGKTWYPKRMVMGCQQSSYFLHKAMHKVLGDVPGVYIYADDILCVSDSVDSHYKLLSTVLSKLKEAGFKLSPGKCQFGVSRLDYLGHQITPEGVSVSADRIECIKGLQPPRSVKETKKVYGFFSWFRKLVPSFSTLTRPLVDLSNSPSFYWNDELQRAFTQLRDALLSSPVLAYPRRDDRFILYSDSSLAGSGQVLTQIQDGEERIIAYSGSKYNRHQRNWTIYELEVYSFMQGLRRFYKFLSGEEFIWRCDCKSALRILSNTDSMNPRLARWRSFIGQFRFSVEHKRASEMQHVDFLSRLHEDEPDEAGDSDAGAGGCQRSESEGAAGQRAVPIAATPTQGGKVTTAPPPAEPVSVETRLREGGDGRPEPERNRGSKKPVLLTGRRSQEGKDPQENERPYSGTDFATNTCVSAVDVNSIVIDNFSDINMEPNALIWYQKHDPYCRAIAFKLTRGKWPQDCPLALKRENRTQFRFVNGILCRQSPDDDRIQVVWPVAKRFEILHKYHDTPIGSHNGMAKLYEVVSRHIWYLGLHRDCQDYVASCSRCSAKKDDQGPPPPPLLPQEPAGPGDELVIDIVYMPASRVSGKSLVLTCIDKFTGFLTFYPLQSQSADDIVHALSAQCLTFGPPRRIECDAGANLKSRAVDRLLQFWGVQRRSAIGGHHEGIGKIERRHRDIKRRLRALSDDYGTDWESHLPGIVFSLNHEVSESHGHSPYFLFFLRHVNSPIHQLVAQPTSPYSHSFIEERLKLLSDSMKRARANMSASQTEQKRRYDLRFRAREPEIRPGDQIRVRNQRFSPGVSRKMVPPWSPVFVVVRWISRRHLEYMDPVTGRVWSTHVKFVKPVAVRPV